MFDDFFSQDDFLIDQEDMELEVSESDSWDTGISPDIFATGESQDIFNTR